MSAVSSRLIARRMGDSPTPPEEIRAMAAAAWHRWGLLLVKPEELDNDFLRQGLETYGARRYGRRDTAPEEKG